MVYKSRKKIIYIAGLGRSGSTLLDLIISTNENVHSIGEVYHFNDIMKRNAPCACGKNVSECNFWSRFYNKKDFLKINNLASWKNYLKILNYLYNPFSKKIPFSKNENNYNLLKEIKNDFILDSSKDITRLIELSQDDRFDIFCIHIIRDGRGTANSYASKRAATSQNFYLVLFKWIVANILTNKFLKKRRIKNIKISLNRLCENPGKYIKKIENFLDIKIGENYSEIIQEMEYHNIGGNKISKVNNRKQFGGIKCAEKWKEEENLFRKIISSLIVYFFNKKWEVLSSNIGTRNNFKKYRFIIELNLILFALFLSGILSDLKKVFLLKIFALIGLLIFFLGGVNLAIILDIFKKRIFDWWEIMAIGASAALFVVPAIAAAIFFITGEINAVTIYGIYSLIFLLMILIMIFKNNENN